MGEFMNSDRQQELLIAERAAQWLNQLKTRETAGLAERLKFVKWMKQSPLHVRELLLATTWDALMRLLDMDRKISIEQLMEQSTRNVTALLVAHRSDNRPAQQSTPESTIQPVNRDAVPEVAREATEPAAPADVKAGKWKSSRWIIGFAAAASILATLALGWPGIIKGIGLPQQYQTDTGEQRTISLTDGSVIYLNTQSLARVAFSNDARDIYLEEGQAIFKVAHDATRPFRVHVEYATVQAIGTQFDVNRHADRTDVAVIEGLVKIIAEGGDSGANSQANTEVSAGKAVTIAAAAEISRPVDVDVAEIVAWRHRRLVFYKETLAEIAAEFNRYNRAPKIRVEGEALQGKRYSGTFDADDPHSFLQYLEIEDRERLLSFDRSDKLVVIRMRSPFAQTPVKKK